MKLVWLIWMLIKHVYKEEWYDSVSVNEIDHASAVKEMIYVREGCVKCEIINRHFRSPLFINHLTDGCFVL